MKSFRIIATTICMLTLSLISTQSARSQDFALKADLVGAALLNVNAGAEMSLAPKWTAELTGSLNAWTLSGGSAGSTGG